MRIGFDARKAGDYGIGTYIRGLLAHLVPLTGSTEWVLFHTTGDEALLPRGDRVTHVPSDAGPYSFGELISLSRAARRHRVDLYHAPHYVLPFGLPCPAVVTIHDLIHLLFPRYLSHPLARYYARFMIGHAVRRAGRIITGTRAAENDLARFFPAARGATVRIPHGVDEVFSPRPLAEAREWLAHSLDLPGEYLLFVGNPKPHKNVDLLLRAFARIEGAYPRLSLLSVGGDEQVHRRLGERARRLGVSRIRFLGNIDTETLALLYSAAAVFIFPSLCEGFGLPPLEAMACGAPVAASTAASLPEVLGPAAAYFSPQSDDSLVSVLCELLDHPAARERLGRLGLERARFYSWDESARRTLAVYLQVGGGAA